MAARTRVGVRLITGKKLTDQPLEVLAALVEKTELSRRRTEGIPG
jgi:hypothetical protein